MKPLIEQYIFLHIKEDFPLRNTHFYEQQNKSYFILLINYKLFKLIKKKC